MAIANPYGADLGSRAPLDALAETPGRIRVLVEQWGDDRFERSYAPGKWSARKVLVHLAQTELALSTRARFALSQQPYTAQAFSQDEWMPLDDGRTREPRSTPTPRSAVSTWRCGARSDRTSWTGPSHIPNTAS